METTTTPDLNWYVVQTKHREELRTEYFLKEKGLEVYLPLIEVATIHNFRNVMKEKPLFPSYLFCRFDPEVSLGYVRWTKGVAKILPESVSPVPVEDRLITTIRTLGQKDGIIRKIPLKMHDQIRIIRGPMKDILGIFEYWTSDEGRIKVLLNFINYQASVELHHSFIEKVAQ